MINIIFFAKYREQFGVPALAIPPAGLETVQHVISHLQAHFPERSAFLSDPKLIIALNQELAKPDQTLRDGDVVAFFPPVTGG